MKTNTRNFGGVNDASFWSDKPIIKGHPKYKEKTKWYHIHWYNISYQPTHKSVCGMISERMNVTLYKCRCGKCQI